MESNASIAFPKPKPSSAPVVLYHHPFKLALSKSLGVVRKLDLGSPHVASSKPPDSLLDIEVRV
jgi:hypothetical protein